MAGQFALQGCRKPEDGRVDGDDEAKGNDGLLAIIGKGQRRSEQGHIAEAYRHGRRSTARCREAVEFLRNEALSESR